MKRISLNSLWFLTIVCMLVSFNGITQTQTTAVPAKEKSVQQKPKLQVDTVKKKPDVKPSQGSQKDKMPLPQQKGEKKPPQKESTDVKGDTQVTPENKQYQHRVEKNEPQGNAYGKNKGDLQGKEFGQQRADQAKLNREVKGKELDDKIVQGEAKVKEARDRIERAKEQLERDKKEGKITEQVYQERKEKISKAEQALSDLEFNIDMGKKVSLK
ncbi:MAG: hypothetical protein PHD61_03655 [Bacteroidales bacterium]|nr:hypothetical protein [Lentimicrobiaceae bacterium]MDD5694382.1 hypothetical protein [Bacteroidales bacterium]